MTRSENTSTELFEPPALSSEDYDLALAACDAAVCEALAVNQWTANRYADAHIGYSTYVFSQMCGRAVSMLRAAPRSRWVRADFEDWHFAAIAGHARAIIEGSLLFSYLADPPETEAEMRARINVLHLYDCTKRIELLSEVGTNQDELDTFTRQQSEIRARLENNTFFQKLSPAVQKSSLSGKKMMIRSRDQILESAGYEKGKFDAFYDLLSQHTHILTISFYRMEPNGRGTGIENDTDRSYIGATLRVCAETMRNATNRLIGFFPDALSACHGVESTFSPGPAENAPKLDDGQGTEGWPTLTPPNLLPLTIAIRDGLKNAVNLETVCGFWHYQPANRFSSAVLLSKRGTAGSH